MAAPNAAESRAAQGLPPTVEDPSVLRKAARIWVNGLRRAQAEEQAEGAGDDERGAA